MKTDAKSLMIAYSLFSVLFIFISSSIVSSFVKLPVMPNLLSFINPYSDYALAQSILGNWQFSYGVGVVSLNFLRNFIAYIVTFPIIVIGFFTMISDFIIYGFTIMALPSTLLMYPFNYLYDIFTTITIAISIIFSIKIVSTGFGS
ncbi:MAG: hypothetical protein QW129_05155 [Thermoplasmata archaeon]